MNNDLIKKLMVSKAIMDKHKEMPRGGITGTQTINAPNVENYESVNANYNIPSEFLGEQAYQERKHNDTLPEKDAIIKSKLPDEIKKLMLENPINKPVQNTAVLSDELVEAASRLMKTNARGDVSNSSKTNTPKNQISGNSDLKQMVKEAVREILSESGLLVESENKSNDLFSFRVGHHIFEGKVTKIKKVK